MSSDRDASPSLALCKAAPAPCGEGTRDAALEHIAQLLDTAGFDSLPGAAPGLAPCPRFYAPRVVASSLAKLRLAMESGLFTYIQGAAEGVGLSTLLADAARTARGRAGAGVTPILYLRMRRSSAVPSKLIRAMGWELGTPISHTAIRVQDTSELTATLLQALRSLRVRLVVVDHVHRLSTPAKEILEDLMWATDPGNTVGLPGPQLPQRIGFVFASHWDVADILADVPSLAGKPDLSPTYLYPYEPEDIATILPQVGLSWAAARKADQAAFVQEIYKVTRGHVTQMNRLFQCMRAVWDGTEPPDVGLVQHALVFVQGVTELVWQRHVGELRGDWESDTDCWVEVHRRTRPTTPATAGPEKKAAAAPTPSQVRERERREDLALAETVRRGLTHHRPRRKRNAK